MFLDAIGIILKKNQPYHHKMVILDKIQGKIECISTLPAFSVGTLITYNLCSEKATYFINHCTLVYSPLTLAQTDILFFHHILEIIYYYTPIGSDVTTIFDLLAFLYTTETTKITTIFKKMFLLKLFMYMGVVPENNNYHTDSISSLSTITNEQLININLNSFNEKELDKWLWSCVWQHPYVNEFKTVHFLAENRAI